jgi:hypothetical protein
MVKLGQAVQQQGRVTWQTSEPHPALGVAAGGRQQLPAQQVVQLRVEGSGVAVGLLCCADCVLCPAGGGNACCSRLISLFQPASSETAAMAASVVPLALQKRQQQQQQQLVSLQQEQVDQQEAISRVGL